jgi:hypothetical protein
MLIQTYSIKGNEDINNKLLHIKRKSFCPLLNKTFQI